MVGRHRKEPATRNTVGTCVRCDALVLNPIKTTKGDMDIDCFYEAAKEKGRTEFIERLEREDTIRLAEEVHRTMLAKGISHDGDIHKRAMGCAMTAAIKQASAPSGATAPRMDAGIPPLVKGSDAATAKPAGGSPHSIECPRRLRNGEVCNKMSPEVRCTKEDECVHQCPSHGHFKIRMDGGIVWLRR